MHQTHDLGPHTPAPHRSNPTTPSDTARTEYSYSPRNVKHPTKGSARSTILQPDMAFEICPASQTDAPALTEAFLAAFSDDFNQTMFPPTADVRAWVAENLFTSTNQQETILKIADPENPSIVAAFAKWIRPGEAHADRESGGIEWPASSDAALCSSFFGTMERHHGELMGERPHYYLEIIGVHPSYQGRGLASKLLKWGLERADEDCIEVYLSSSPEGKPVYEKYGFQSRNAFSPFSGYVQLNMIRPVQK